MAGPSKRILLVEADTADRTALVGHLARAGYEVTTAEDGAVAINRALQEPPDMIITAVDMRMVDGFKLCQLLRTNPATRTIPFIFITDKETNPRRLGEYIRPADDFILKPYKTIELLGRIHNLFYRLDKVQEVSAEADRSVAGTLTEIALVDLLQIFKMNRKSGVLTLRGDGQTGTVFLRDGTVINARVGKVGGEKAIYRLVAWQRGTFEFKPGPAPGEVVIHQPTENLVMEGLRQYDELNQLAGKLPPRSAFLRVRKTFTGHPSRLKPVTREVLQLLEYFSRVDDLVDNSTFPDLEVYASVQNLLEHGVVEVSTGESVRATKAGGPLLSLEEALKIGYYLGVGQNEPQQRWVGKALVFTQEQDLLEDFLRRAEVVPEFRREEAEGVPADARDFCGTGVRASVTVMDRIVLHLLNLPARTGCEPLWQAFHHRAVGAILLGEGGVAADAVFEPVAGFLVRKKIPYAAAAMGGGGSPDSRSSLVHWEAVDRSSPDFARRVLRLFFEAVLAR